MNKTFYIPQVTESRMGYEHVEIQGTPIVILGFEEYSFFITKERNEWMIREARTGEKLIGAFSDTPTRKQAILKATENLNKYGKVEFERCVKCSIEKKGISPLYKKEAWDGKRD